MAARKPKPKPRGASRNSSSAPARKPVPGWLWLLAGAALGGFFAFLALLKPGGDGVKREAAGKPSASAAKPAAQPPAPAKPKYDFYTLLPQSSGPAALMQPPNETQVHANEAARAQALLDGRTPPPRLVVPQPSVASAPAATPHPASCLAPPPTPPPSPPRAPAPAPAPAKLAPASAPPAKPAATPTASEARYYLQAGSYASREQADTARARLTLLGQNVRIESGKVGDKTWHRVVLGPFASRQQAEGTQKDLKSSGVGSVLQQRR